MSVRFKLDQGKSAFINWCTCLIGKERMCTNYQLSMRTKNEKLTTCQKKNNGPYNPQNNKSQNLSNQYTN